MVATHPPIALVEYQTRRLPPASLPLEAGNRLWRIYDRDGGVLDVAFPSPKTDGEWEITPQGWVGTIPLTPEITFSLHPRVPLNNLFRVLAYAYRLASFRFLDGLSGCESLSEFYDLLAVELAQRVLARARHGLHEQYRARQERLPYTRGRIDFAKSRPWHVHLPCRYEARTADIADNQILLWTLATIIRRSPCGERARTLARRAASALLQRSVTLLPFDAADCIGRTYSRLNEDYRALHALCRFFLASTGPTHSTGQELMLPFLVNMPRLYELFVAEWLRHHLPDGWQLSAQELVRLPAESGSDGDSAGDLRFNVDLVLNDPAGTPRMVLDTKYKRPLRVAPGDLYQAVTYATLLGCHEALLVYPTPPVLPLDSAVGEVRIRTVCFGLEGDLDRQGAAFLEALRIEDPFIIANPEVPR